MGSILGGILGGGSSPGQDAQMQGLKASREDIQKYRPEAMQARLNALSNATSAYQGANNALETLYGAPQQPQTMGEQMRGGMPRRMMGHDLPEAAPVATSPNYVAHPNSGGHSFSLLDPLGIFGGF